MNKKLDAPLKKINIEYLVLWEEANVRKDEPAEDIEDLANNIKQNGLRVPLLVKEKSTKEFLVFSGQRRLLACAKAGLPKVPCFVFKNISLNDARILSLSENLYRLKMTYNDVSNAAKSLYEHYGSLDKVSTALGVSKETVKRYLGYNAIPNELKELVGMKKITAAQAIDIYSKFPDQNKSIKIARELSRIQSKPSKQKFYTATRDAKESDSMETIRKNASKIKPSKNYSVALPSAHSKIIEDLATIRFMEPAEFLSRLLEKALIEYQKGTFDI
jgi:ParB/RepB/Spo0J family partition protein